MTTTRDRAVIIGGSAAGVSAAMAMRRGGFDGAITVVDSDVREPYERPPLSKALLSQRGALLRPILPAQPYQDKRFDLVLGRRVDALTNTRPRIETG